MKEIIRVQGRELFPDDINYIREQINDHPEWHRTRLSREICAAWNWTNEVGRPKDMAARTMLLKLERRGLLKLPPRRMVDRNQFRGKSFKPVLHDASALDTMLRTVQPIELTCADRGSQACLWRTLMVQYHYWGSKRVWARASVTSPKPMTADLSPASSLARRHGRLRLGTPLSAGAGNNGKGIFPES